MKSLVTVLLTGAGLALAPVALADGSDDQFLSALAAAGIPAHDGIPGVIAHGHKVCDVLGAGMSPGEAANELAHHAYAEDPSHPFDQYLRSMQAFVRVSTQSFCPGHGAAYHHGARMILVGQNIPSPPPVIQEVPNVVHLAAPPPVQVAKPTLSPPPVQKPPPPPPEVIPPPSEGSQGGQGKGGTGGGIDGGGTSSGGTQSAPEPSEGHVVLLP